MEKLTKLVQINAQNLTILWTIEALKENKVPVLMISMGSDNVFRIDRLSDDFTHEMVKDLLDYLQRIL